MRSTWDCYPRHPEFLRLAGSENRHRARQVRRSPVIREARRRLIDMVAGLPARGDPMEAPALETRPAFNIGTIRRRVVAGP